MENEDIKYESTATIVINESDTAYDDAKPRVMNAQEISAILRYDKRRQEELAELKRKVESVQEYLRESYNDLEDHAQEIADLLDIELTRDVLVTVTVEWEIQLAVKPGDDIGDIVDNLSFSIDTCDEVTDYTEGMVDWTES
jgi:hypothetical protein